MALRFLVAAMHRLTPSAHFLTWERPGSTQVSSLDNTLFLNFAVR